MFYYLNGELAYRDMNTCVIDCHGVGYKLTVSTLTSESLMTRLSKQVKLYTHLAVREDGIELFGFGSNEEKECFNTRVLRNSNSLEKITYLIKMRKKKKEFF